MASASDPAGGNRPAVPDDPFSRYDPGGFFCELTGARTDPAAAALLAEVRTRMAALGVTELRRRQDDFERELYNLGITFTVYSDADAIDRILPCDVIPRVIPSGEWRTIETGVVQRLQALNLFLWDIYHEQKILADGVVPADLVLGNKNFRKEMMGVDVPHGTYVHICGTDIVRDGRGTPLVLEDNGRTPSGVSYVVENRYMMQRIFPDVMAGLPIRKVDDYGLRLHQAMVAIAPPTVNEPQVVLLSPGVFNSAYFEHVFLAREMGVPLVEGRDLVVRDERVWLKTTAGLAPVDVIYRRLNDDFLDPLAFNPESMLGVPGLFDAYRKGNVALANAIGTGVADDKAIYAYMPRIIRYYLDQDAILSNVETNLCREKDGLARTLDNLDRLVTKPVGEAGGYGVVVGPRATKAELAELRALLLADPANYISQPMVELSVSPTLIEDRLEPRHIDLRPFAVTGDRTWVLPGGLTRVALRRGSLVVNSSQGGGSKDTWVLA
ncbi:MAG: circularly permuted type 2 ATP-grasp protein [Alphaproteobacteria bacterium]